MIIAITVVNAYEGRIRKMLSSYVKKYMIWKRRDSPIIGMITGFIDIRPPSLASLYIYGTKKQERTRTVNLIRSISSSAAIATLILSAKFDRCI
jgi:hypothetical protein